MTRALLSLWREYRKEYKARIKAGHENEARLKEKRKVER
jgi:hypothetical protein